MANERTVLVCDDDASRVNEWAAQIQGLLVDVEVSPLSPVDFAQSLAALKDRRINQGESNDDDAVIFDGADVVVIDSDLTPDHDATYEDDPGGLVHTHLTTEMGGEVAHLLRSFTSAGALVVVNEGTQQRTFDLTLSGRVGGAADVYVGDEDIANPGLWSSSTPADRFRPWVWPRLDLLPSTIQQSVAELDLAQAWLTAIGLDPVETPSLLLEGQIESLGLIEASGIASMTFHELSEDGRLGLRRKEVTTDEYRSRVAACSLRRWLERVLLPVQNVLVDLPHLMQHQPWLVPDRETPAGWAGSAGRWWPDDPPIAEQAFNEAASKFIGRNVWDVWKLDQRPTGARAHPDDPVFCEDTSEFQPIDQSADFVSNIEGPFARRFIADVSDVEYMPRNRLAR